MDTALYYILSSLSQVVAALLGFSFVYFLFAKQKLEEDMNIILNETTNLLKLSIDKLIPAYIEANEAKKDTYEEYLKNSKFGYRSFELHLRTKNYFSIMQSLKYIYSYFVKFEEDHYCKILKYGYEDIYKKYDDIVENNNKFKDLLLFSSFIIILSLASMSLIPYICKNIYASYGVIIVFILLLCRLIKLLLHLSKNSIPFVNLKRYKDITKLDD